MNCGILSLGADIRGIDLRRRKVPQGSPLLLQQQIDALTNNQQIDDHGHPPLPLMGGQCLVLLSNVQKWCVELCRHQDLIYWWYSDNHWPVPTVLKSSLYLIILFYISPTIIYSDLSECE